MPSPLLRGGKRMSPKTRAALASTPPAPAFRDEDYTETRHGHTRRLPYQWMAQKKHPQLRAFLEAENQYARANLPKAFAETLADEADAREPESAPCLPYQHNGYWHFTREDGAAGGESASSSFESKSRRNKQSSKYDAYEEDDDDDDDEDMLYCRKPVHCDPDFEAKWLKAIRANPKDPQLPQPDEDEEIVVSEQRECTLLRVDKVDVEGLEYNPSQSWVAYTANLTGKDDHFQLIVKDVASGMLLRRISYVDGHGRPAPQVVWASDAVLYFGVCNETNACTKLARLDLSAVYSGTVPCTPVSEDDRIAKSADGKTSPPYSCTAKYLNKAKITDGKAGITIAYKETMPGYGIERIVMTHDESHMGFEVTRNTSNEWRFAYLGDDGRAAEHGELDWAVFWPREADLIYEAHPHPSNLWIVNYHSVKYPQGKIDLCNMHGCEEWPVPKSRMIPLIAYDAAVPIADVTVLRDYIVCTVRVDAFPRLLLLDRDVAVTRMCELQQQQQQQHGQPPSDAGKPKDAFRYSDLVDVHTLLAEVNRAWATREDDVYVVQLVGDADGFNASHFRIAVASMTGPLLHFNLIRSAPPVSAGGDTMSKKHWRAEFLYEEQVAVEHNRNDYAAKVVWAPVTESVGPDHVIANAVAATPNAATISVPVLVVYRKDTFRKGKNPIILNAYGSYGEADTHEFDLSSLSLLDRGVVFAEAYVRGGGQLGHAWHHAGRFDARPNSITDFIACTEYLAKEGWCDPARIAAYGASAGGTLMGGLLVRAPSLYRCVVLEVPFVDCLTTMLDAKRPLTREEWDEWGNPVESAADYLTILGYTPMDNLPSLEAVEAAGTVFPDVAIVSGFNDSRVSIQEPASFNAALRRIWGPSAANGRKLLHAVEFDGGHAGPGDEDAASLATASMDAFMMTCLGVNANSPVHGATFGILDDATSSSGGESEGDRSFRRPRCLDGGGRKRGFGGGSRM